MICFCSYIQNKKRIYLLHQTLIGCNIKKILTLKEGLNNPFGTNEILGFSYPSSGDMEFLPRVLYVLTLTFFLFVGNTNERVYGVEAIVVLTSPLALFTNLVLGFIYGFEGT